VVTVPACTAALLGASLPDYATFPSGFVYKFGAVVVATFRVGTAEMLRFCERTGVPQLGGATPRLVVDLLAGLARAATNNLEHSNLCRLESDIGQGPVWGMGASSGAPAAKARHLNLSYLPSPQKRHLAVRVLMAIGGVDNDNGDIYIYIYIYIYFI